MTSLYYNISKYIEDFQYMYLKYIHTHKLYSTFVLQKIIENVNFHQKYIIRYIYTYMYCRYFIFKIVLYLVVL